MSDAVSLKKPVKKHVIENRTTLDAIHQAHVKEFMNTDEELASIISQLENIQAQLGTCAKEESCDLSTARTLSGSLLPQSPQTEQSSAKIASRNDLLKEKERLEKRRTQLEKKDDLMDYYLQTGNLLFEYYTIQDKISAGEAFSTGTRIRPGTVFAALEAAAETNPITPAASAAPLKKAQQQPSFDREKLLDRYLQVIQPEMARNITNELDDNWSECPNCSTEMIFSMNEAYVSCKTCGYQDHILIDSDKPSYKDPPREIAYYAYKRINHFNEWLAQFQAKESTEIPQEIFDGILLELKKERITDMTTLKVSKLREILRKLKYNKYYEHIPHILNRLNGQSAPVMSRDNEEKLRHMFREIQPSFQKHCPADRSNFLSYSYVLYKFCELLELDEFLPCFPLLKNRDKLYAQDKIWEKICSELHWQFLRTL